MTTEATNEDTYFFFLSEDEEGMINGAFVSQAFWEAWKALSSEHLFDKIADKLPEPDDWDEVAESMFQYLGFHDVATLRARLEEKGFIWKEEIVNGE